MKSKKAMRYVIAFLVLVSSFSFLIAQDQEDAVFAYIYNPEGHQPNRNVADYKYETAARVFESLVQARGDFRKPRPDFIMNDGQWYSAWVNPSKEELGLEEKAYDICASMGTDSLNALAALLAHELTHYYEKHDWSRSFAQSNKNIGVAKIISSVKKDVGFETQADELGGYLALSAGYDPYGIIPELLPKIYEEYTLPDSLEGYPTLTDRIAIAKNAAEQAHELHRMYETATLLTAVEAYEEAFFYYEYILGKFQSRELYNNLGVLYTRAALQYFREGEMPYALPLELDADTRLGRGTRNADLEAEKKQREDWLYRAEEQFENARNLDADYPAAMLNTAIVYLLQGLPDEAFLYARKAQRNAKRLGLEKERQDAEVVLGIVAALQGDESEAADRFREAAEQGNASARVNLLLIGENSKVPAGPAVITPSEGAERIEGVLLDQFVQNPKVDKQLELGKKTGIYCGWYEKPQSRILIHYVNEGPRYAYFHRTLANYEGTTLRGLKPGATEEDIRAAYTSPSRMMPLRRGTFLVYPEEKMIFQLDEKGQSQSWIVYRLKLDKEQ